MILFLVCAVIYTVLFFLWTVVGLNGGVSLADTDAIAAGIPLLGDLPTQSVSKIVVSALLYLLAIVYGLLAATSPEERRALPQLLIIGVLTFLAWMVLNFWVVSGFLNSPAVLIYGAASVVLLIAWGVALARGVMTIHDAVAIAFADRVEALLRGERGDRPGRLHRDAADAPVRVAGGEVVGVDRGVRARERAQAQVDDADGEARRIVRRSRDLRGKAPERGEREPRCFRHAADAPSRARRVASG